MNLNIDMIARFASVTDALEQISRKATTSGAQMERAFGAIKSTLATLGVGISIVGITSFVKSAVDAIAVLDDIAERTGASVAELSKYEQVARIGGHATEVFETALIRMGKALHAQDDEAKGAGKALAALGLSQDALRGKDTAEALRIVAVELNKYADGSGKTALAIDLLGKSGAQALPFLKDLATEHGIAARVTTEQAAAAEELQKSLKRLQLESRNVSQALLIELVPALTRVIKDMQEASTVAGGLASGFMLLTRTNALKDFGLDVATTTKQLAGLRAEKDRVSKSGPVDTSGLDLAIADAEKRIKLLKFQQQQAALVGSGADTPGEMQRFGLEGAVLPKLDYAGSKTAKAGLADVENPYRQIMADLEKKLLLDKESTQVDQLIITLTNLRADAYAKLSIAQLVNLESAAFDVDLKKQALAADKAFVDELERQKGAKLELNEALAAERAVRDAGVDSIEKSILQTQFETRLLGMSTDERIRATAARDLELAGIKKFEQGYESLLIRLTQGRVTQETLRESIEAQKAVFDEMGEFAKEASRGIQSTLSDNLFDVLQGKFDKTGARFKAMLDRMMADALAKNLASALFGDMDKTGVIGGLIRKGLDALGFGPAPAPVSDAVLSPGFSGDVDPALVALSASATTADAAMVALSATLPTADAGLVALSTTLTTADAGLVAFAASTPLADAALVALASSATAAASALATMGATSGAGGGGLAGGVLDLFESMSTGYATGTDYVPRTGFYKLHQGEKVTPAGQNSGGDVHIHQNIYNDSRSDQSSIRQGIAVATQQSVFAVEDANRRSRR